MVFIPAPVPSAAENGATHQENQAPFLAMNIPMRAFILIGASVLSLPTSLFAQSGTPSAPVTDTTRPSVYELTARWDQKMSSEVLSVPLRNDSDRPLEVLGVQSTRGIFIADFPGKIAPGKEDVLSAIYLAADNTEGDTDLIRVLTDLGIKEILVKVRREEAVRFDARRLTWTVGEAADAKNLSVTVPGRETMPKAVRTVGRNSATLEFPAPGQYVIKVTPGSTAEPQTFPVFVDFDPALPGGPVVLTCVVEKK